MFTDKDEALEKELLSSESLVIESMYNNEFEVWEVSLQGMLMGNFVTEEEASSFATSLHLAVELGYMNGLLLGYKDKEAAKEALEQRGVEFSTYLNLED